jgi:hypothetical protein
MTNIITTDLYLEALADPLKLLPEKTIIQITKNDLENDDSFKIEENIESINHKTFNNMNDSDVLSNIKELNISASSPNFKNNYESPDFPNFQNLNKQNISKQNLNKQNIKEDLFNKDLFKEDLFKEDLFKEDLFKEDLKEIKITPSIPKLSIAEQKVLKFKKMESLAKLMNIKNSGVELTRNYNMESDIDDIEAELKYHTDIQSKKNGLQLVKSFMCNCITGIEYLNDKYDPFGFKLNGWAEEVKSNKDDFDEVFGELLDKYKGNGKKMEPELKLIMLLMISAGSFHLSQSLSSNLPGLDDIIKNNPKLLSKIQSNINKTVVGPSEYDKKKEIYDNLKKIHEKKKPDEKKMSNKSKKIDVTNKKSTSVKNLLKDIKKSIPLNSAADTCSITVGNTINSESEMSINNIKISNEVKTRNDKI